LGRSGILFDRLRAFGATCTCGLTIVLGAGSNVARASEGAGGTEAVPVIESADPAPASAEPGVPSAKPGEGVVPAPPALPAAAMAAAPAGRETPKPAVVTDSRTVVAPLAGALTLVVPLMVGSFLVARDDNPRLQNIGSTVMLAGFAAAPWVSHALAGRWGRGLAFGGAALAASAATWIVMAARDPYDPNLGNRKRLPFGLLITTSFFFGAAGVTDSFIVGPEQRQP